MIWSDLTGDRESDSGIGCCITPVQNIPARTKEGKKIRQAFVAAPGKILIVADYSQLEMRILAHYSRDERLIKSILSGEDVHCWTVADMFGLDYAESAAAKKKADQAKDTHEKLTEREEWLMSKRDAAKTIGFGVVYGMKEHRLSRRLNCPLQEAKELLDRYLDARKGVKDYMHRMEQRVAEQGCVKTIFGRKRRIPGLRRIDGRPDNEAARQAINAPIQGTASDLAKLAMLACRKDLVLTDLLGCKLMLQVHDELIFEIDDDENKVAQAKELIKKHMLHPRKFELEVPLDLDIHSGYDWAACH